MSGAEDCSASFSITSFSDSDSRDARAPRKRTRLLELDRLRYFRSRDATGLLGRLADDTLPAFHAFCGCRCQMRLGAAGDQRDDSCHTQLRTLLDCPLHAIELEDGQRQCDMRMACSRNRSARARIRFDPVGHGRRVRDGPRRWQRYRIPAQPGHGARGTGARRGSQ